MQAGDQHPQQTQKPEDSERVVEPQPAAGINNHQNACSLEHAFAGKHFRRHKRITLCILVGAATLVLGVGCLPDPQRTQSLALLDRLVTAQAMLAVQPLHADDACNTIGDVQTRLYGEPGLVDVRPAWPALVNAAHALQTVCGQSIMLSQPSIDSPVLTQARQRWTQGMQRELGVACDSLRLASTALGRPTPCGTGAVGQSRLNFGT